MESINFKIDTSELKDLVKALLSKQFKFEVLTKKNKINFMTESNQILFSIRPPLNLPRLIPNLEEWLKLPEIDEYVVLLARSGIASVGLFKSGKFTHHKVFRSYLNRKKQGKSQITYLKTKGKSRAGSRVRLENAKTFITNLNTYINKINPLNRIPLFYFIPVPLLSFWRQSSTHPPKAILLHESKTIPLNVKTPGFDEMKRVNKLLQKAEINFPNKDDYVKLETIFKDLKRE
jgi:hypothetical protein